MEQELLVAPVLGEDTQPGPGQAVGVPVFSDMGRRRQVEVGIHAVEEPVRTPPPPGQQEGNRTPGDTDDDGMGKGFEFIPAHGCRRCLLVVQGIRSILTGILQAELNGQQSYRSITAIGHFQSPLPLLERSPSRYTGEASMIRIKGASRETMAADGHESDTAGR